MGGWSPRFHTCYATLTDDDMPAGEEVLVHVGDTLGACYTMAALEAHLQHYVTLDEGTRRHLGQDRAEDLGQERPSSVLLTYPDDADADGALATYDAQVQASDPIAAVHAARIEAVQFHWDGDTPASALRDFAVLLVTEGHHVDDSGAADNALCTEHQETVTCRHCDTLTPKAFAGPNKAGDGWIGEECWEDSWEEQNEEEAPEETTTPCKERRETTGAASDSARPHLHERRVPHVRVKEKWSMKRCALDERDLTIRGTRSGLFWAHHHGPAVGDYVDVADGITRRRSHVWDMAPPSIQTSDGGSFYLGNGYCSLSGGLYPGIDATTLSWTGETREGSVWFFHHDSHTAHNGVETSMPFAVSRCPLPAHPAYTIEEAPMVDPEFFPTPRAVAQQRIARISKHARSILEPRAGKGDIVDAIKGHERYDHWDRCQVDCIEIHPELIATLQGKGYTVVGTDWLTYSGVSYDQAMLMHPPCSSGDAPLLKAWDFLSSGEIVCLLNAETVRNPYTERRQRLAQLIAAHGEVEELGPVFQHAERSTDAEVVLVYLNKETDDDRLELWQETTDERPVADGSGADPQW